MKEKFEYLYKIKNYTGDKFETWSSEIDLNKSDFNWARLAEEIAEDYYYQDPSDPNYFECEVKIKHGDIVKTFDICGSITISFDANEAEEE